MPNNISMGARVGNTGYSHAFLAAKTADIALASTYFFFFSLVASVALNFLTQVYESYTMADTNAEKSLPRLMFEIVANIFFIVFSLWVIRNVVERIPFPLEGYGGYTHTRLSLATVISLSSITMFFFQTALMDKIRELNTRLYGATKLSDSWFGRTLQQVTGGDSQ